MICSGMRKNFRLPKNRWNNFEIEGRIFSHAIKFNSNQANARLAPYRNFKNSSARVYCGIITMAQYIMDFFICYKADVNNLLFSDDLNAHTRRRRV